MKRLSYKIVVSEPDTEVVVLQDMRRVCSESRLEAQYAIAQQEAYNGEVTVEDVPDPELTPTQEEDTAAMLVDHEFRLTLLELGLTE